MGPGLGDTTGLHGDGAELDAAISTAPSTGLLRSRLEDVLRRYDDWVQLQSDCACAWAVHSKLVQAIEDALDAVPEVAMLLPPDAGVHPHSWTAWLNVELTRLSFFVENRDLLHRHDSYGRALARQLRERIIFLQSLDPSEPLCPKEAGESIPTSTTVEPVPDDAHLSPAKLAEIFNVPADALRTRLNRWRAKHHDGWIENRERKPHEAVYLYRVRDVRPVIDNLRATNGPTSVRPAKES